MPKPKKADSLNVETQEPAPLLGESPLGAAGSFSEPPAETAEDGAEPVTTQRARRPRKKRGPKVAEPAEPVEVDKNLIATCAIGVQSLTNVAQSMLGFSDPGSDWRRVASELTARWLSKLENTWILEHPTEAALLLHLAVWVIPNGAMAAANVLERRRDEKQKRDEAYRDQRNNPGLRPQADAKDTLPTAVHAEASASHLH